MSVLKRISSGCRGLAVAAAAVLLLGLGSAGTAGATYFTLGSSVDLSVDTGSNSTGITGNLEPSATTSGTSVCLDGTCTLGSQDVLVFVLSVDSGSIDELRTGVGLLDIKGMGMFTGSDVDATSGALDAPLVFPPFSVIGATFDFDGATAPNPNVDGGDDSNVLFITFDSGTLSGGETAGFMLQGPSVALFSVEGTVSAISVPEPGSLVLLGSLLALAAGVRRRSSR